MEKINLSCALCGYFCDNEHHYNNWYEKNEGRKFLKVYQLRELENKVMSEKITYSKMVEILNEMAHKFYNKPKTSRCVGESNKQNETKT